jgi:hypothetical protein
VTAVPPIKWRILTGIVADKRDFPSTPFLIAFPANKIFSLRSNIMRTDLGRFQSESFVFGQSFSDAANSRRWLFLDDKRGFVGLLLNPPTQALCPSRTELDGYLKIHT